MQDEFRTYNNIQGDYYIAQRFLHRVAMHIVKNYLHEKLKGVKIPLILGIWGPKGTGKTFQTELSFRKMNANPIIMSAGELEDGTAGKPGYLIRRRYRDAADMSKSRGVLSCLMVNDIDAGLGRFEVCLAVAAFHATATACKPLSQVRRFLKLLERCALHLYASGYSTGRSRLGVLDQNVATHIENVKCRQRQVRSTTRSCALH